MSAIDGTSFEAEAAHMREIQRWHLERGWATVGYHFVISPGGRIFRGRPVDRLGAHVLGHNGGTVGIGLMGDFEHERPTPAALASLVHVRSRLVPDGAKARLLAHRDHRGHETSACPGRNLSAYADKRGGPPPGGPPAKRRADP
jgi:N-acetylmuramoyl-L-alanine amidase